MENKKITVIIGSPKKSGQTIEQVKAFVNCLKEYCNVDSEYLYLSDYDIKDCIGCNVCFDKGEEFCPLKDDRDIILSKMLQSDAVIWVSPIYAMHISYLLVKYMDRLAFLFHRPGFQSKKAFIVVVKGNQFKGAIKYMESCLNQWGFDCVGSLGLPPLLNMPETVRVNMMKTVNKKAYHFAAEIKKNNKMPPGVIQLVNYKMWQMRARSKDTNHKDFMFFNENSLFNKNYFYETKISKVKLLIAGLLFQFLKIYIKKNLGGFSNI